jgi:hypothetical protein
VGTNFLDANEEDEDSTVSIQLISPASGDNHSYLLERISPGFHSINIPSEWGRDSKGNRNPALGNVSIQLISPASGDPFRNL